MATRYVVTMNTIAYDSGACCTELVESEIVGEFDTLPEAQAYAAEQNAKHDGVCAESEDGTGVYMTFTVQP